MFRAPKKRALERTNFGKEVVRDQDYPERLSLYTVPPLQEITLDEFEIWALDRLRVLGEIENCLSRNKAPKALEAVVKPIIDKYLSLSPNSPSAKSSILDGERRKDHYSHFILRLAFCRSDELRSRFVKAESVLFRIRYANAEPAEWQNLISHYSFGWTQVSEEEKFSLRDELVVSTTSSDHESYFKVPFERVPELVADRRVFLKHGDAYVPVSQQISLVLAEFSSRLSKALELTARALPRLDEDDRLVPILNHISRGFVAPEYFSSDEAMSVLGETVKAVQVDSLVSHFPLCMQQLHKGLRRDHHLRYYGRQQYGLFLKGIGLSVEEALIFWRQSFSEITDEKFSKEYRYNVRHNYGLEGSRKNYRPHNCVQIIGGNPPGPGDLHGCPYRHFSEDNLVAALGSMGVHDNSILRQVKEDVKNKHYHVACTKVFEYTHAKYAPIGEKGSVLKDEAITHPNLYFDRSVQVAKAAKARADG
ncbi:eukaryotic and archaeal DNA primase, large subunit-domain-containing protein [Lipomyces japonicus]|uniref:eukaryotic and archaeal DNA primase, large subunit-domain-containing protein n=1 Tax=Lipomyces japonicus TaxID=56871 RepID=UPI0034CFF000